MVQAVSTELTIGQVTEAINAIIDVLGTPETNVQIDALSAFHKNDYQTVKRLASTNLSDNYCKSLGYLGGALKLTPNTDTILAESARAAAEVAKERTLKQLGAAIASALN
ncbi:hypothetical protein [Nostoc sp. UIC 10630]|uniref:hypothetical protein n=1 Tax=Nostoc sp. UIC 10630 TaxID=2100146 RepID=UPI0013D86E14|nr:hypothetical protein [Nostoc sp. UIC 10630]NEU77617.1 hypothetical protein [Nostoc sp. UIC 10630]